MNVIVNGNGRDLPAGTSLAGLLESLGLAGARVVVEVNGAVIGRPRHASTAVREGDRVEIVRLVGGG